MICLQGIVVCPAMSFFFFFFLHPTEQARDAEGEKVFLEVEKHEFLDPAFMHVVVKAPETARDA